MKNVDPEIRRFLIGTIVVAALLSAVPMIVGALTAPSGWQFLGYPFATDDHMVYASWMRQAQEGRFFFDNRFATESQPGLTINLYFFFAGLISKIFGIAWTTTILKAAFSAWFVWLAYQLINRITQSVFTQKVALALVVFGSGLGFLVWHQFGEEIVKPSPTVLKSFLNGRLPTDVWQPEGFVFSSMLTNSLFVAALCFMLLIVRSLIDAQKDWKSVPLGFLSMLALANFHTYDALLLGLVSIAFLAATLVHREMTGAWALRGLAIFAGAIPSGAWVAYVLKQDPVFAARAATLTYSPNFREVLVGYGLLLLFGILWILTRKEGRSSLVGGLIALAVVAVLAVAGGSPVQGYFLSPIGFAAAAVAMVVAAALATRSSVAATFVVSWALVGLVAIYFPALFQRKLAMGLSIPWAILAALFLAERYEKLGSEPRRILSGCTVLAMCLSSIFWLQREVSFIKEDVSRTTVHSAFLPPEVVQMISSLNREPGRKTLIAMPGIPELGSDDDGLTSPDYFTRPLWPDMNAVFSGLVGCYSYAGHWSETPNYTDRRKETSKFFYLRTPDEYRRDLIQKAGANYILGPSKSAFGSEGSSAFFDASTIGTVIAQGREFLLVKVDPEKLAKSN